MFETSRPKHPLHTFRFWFFIFAATVVTVAWKFDLLPVRIGPAATGRLATDEFREIEEPLDSASEADIGDLPFSDEDQLLDVPSLASDRRLPTAPLQEGSGGSVDLPLQSEPDQTFAGGTGPERRESFDLFDDQDWPSAPATVQSQRLDPPSKHVPEGAQILQTNATSALSSSGRIPEVRTADNSTVAVPAQQAAARLDLNEVEALLATGLVADEIEAHRLLSTIYWQEPDSRPQIRERIDTLAQKIYFQKSRHYMDAYQVQPGDMLQQIAQKYDISWQYLAKLNRVDPKRVRAGQRLKVIKGPFSAIVDLSDYELTIHAHGYYVTRYAVGIGKDGSSPIGKFTVQEKLIDPTYYGPDGVIAHDDPTNPLGEYWIDIGNSYGIHGTIDPLSIGKNESQGCIRLHNDEAAAVYDLLTIGSEVIIRP